MPTARKPPEELKRVLGAADAAWLVAGNMIGAGIFFVPGVVAALLPGLGRSLVAWTAGGLLALAGALVYAELGARLPHAGGDYRYLTAAFGPLWGFLTGWAALLLTFSAAAAVMAIVAADYVAASASLVGFADLELPRLVPPILILLLTLANTVGARFAGWTTLWLTAIPLAGLAGLFGYGLVAGHAQIEVPHSAGYRGAAAELVAFAGAMLPVYFTYSGWNAAAYVAGEIRDPQRNLGRGLVAGTIGVIFVYLLVTTIVLLVVPQAELAGSTTAGAQAARRLLGPRAEGLLSLVIAAAVLGSVNVTLMAGGRIYWAMARDGLGPRLLTRTGRAGVPSVALWVGGAWSAVLALFGEVGVLLDWATLAILLLSSLAAAALFVLRRRQPASAGFRCPAYPWIPALYVVASLAVAAGSAIQQPLRSLYGVLIVAAGVPVFLWARRSGSR